MKTKHLCNTCANDFDVCQIADFQHLSDLIELDETDYDGIVYCDMYFEEESENEN